MSRVTTAGQRHDSIGFPPVLADVRIARPWGGPPRIRPDHVLADKAYSSKEIRDYLAGRTIRAAIPERADQQHHRVRRRRPAPAFDPDSYRHRNVVERCINKLNTTAPSPPATTSVCTCSAARSTSPRSGSGSVTPLSDPRDRPRL